ncbi:hypothetical protein Daura_27120 [Dactylosporangium aurantiacum]|uniref:Uncharacterized protein n=1 Tax=Dactylosporangium aurantiacum TaxID=35754 RepID=A0A9Q9IC50_9ACTN|nr:hypothetical protein [Dactylosporangium aurantiacum]MDG6106462.1 hypothetical protein [Dactylosporangium aurantiacum]UWZ50503.1 hypothetical protein Daura_27120 [Dactylosporangium aurantiacum]
MKSRHTGLVVRFVLAGVLVLLGWQMLASGSTTDAQRQQESARRIAEYRPTCDGKTMRPRDTCLVFGGSGDEGGSYQHMMDMYAAANSPRELAERDRGWRVAGYVALGIGALTLLCFLLSLVEVIRFGADEPQDATISYQRRLVGLAVAGAMAAVGVLLIGESGNVVSWLLAVAGVLLTAAALASLVSAFRTRVGRRRWAKAHGHAYERCDKDLLQRLGWSDALPFAGGVVTGTHRDRAFLVFDYAEKDARHTALVMGVPGELPPLVVEAKLKGGPRLLTGTAQHWVDHATEVVAAADRHYPWAFKGNGATLWAKYDEVLSPSGEKLQRRLDGLHRVGTALAAMPG